MEQIGKEKGDRPDEDNRDHSPDTRLDKRSREYSGGDLSASVGMAVDSTVPLIKKQHRHLREPNGQCRCELCCKEHLSTSSAMQ